MRATMPRRAASPARPALLDISALIIPFWHSLSTSAARSPSFSPRTPTVVLPLAPVGPCGLRRISTDGSAPSYQHRRISTDAIGEMFLLHCPTSCPRYEEERWES